LRGPYRLKLIDERNDSARLAGDVHSDPVGGAHNAPADLSDWVVTTAPRAVAYATSLLRDRERAEDVVQDCYCRLLAKADVYDLRADGLKLLLTSISNACINLEARRRGVFSLFGKDGRPPEIEDRAACAPSGNLLHAELADAVGRALARLPVRQRAAIELKSQGHSLQAVAEILGLSPNNAGVLIHRARAALEVWLAPYVGGREP
jgi:RNA polymerase sigma-70 factor, ECF subfamily